MNNSDMLASLELALGDLSEGELQTLMFNAVDRATLDQNAFMLAVFLCGAAAEDPLVLLGEMRAELGMGQRFFGMPS